MSNNVEMNRGTQGAKRASWEKPNFRDLAIKIIESNPGADLEYLAEEFMDGVKKHPTYMRSIAIYVMANVLTAVEAKRPSISSKRERDILIEPTLNELEEEIVQKQATKTTAKIVSNLLGLKMPNGKELGDCNGAECGQLGRFGSAILKKIGPRGIVREKISEAELQKLFAISK